MFSVTVRPPVSDRRIDRRYAIAPGVLAPSNVRSVIVSAPRKAFGDVGDVGRDGATGDQEPREVGPAKRILPDLG